jgi:hypothetical protein
MTVYVDDAVTLWRDQRWAHLMADSLEELHAFASRLGLPRHAFQDRRSGAHYDVTAAMRAHALELGAVAISRHTDRARTRAVIARARELATGGPKRALQPVASIAYPVAPSAPPDPAMTDTPPDRLSTDPRSPFHDAALIERGVGVRFKGLERTDVEEYCVSEGWIRVQAGRARDRRGNPMTMKLNGEVVAYFYDQPA